MHSIRLAHARDELTLKNKNKHLVAPVRCNDKIPGHLIARDTNLKKCHRTFTPPNCIPWNAGLHATADGAAFAELFDRVSDVCHWVVSLNNNMQCRPCIKFSLTNNHSVRAVREYEPRGREFTSVPARKCYLPSLSHLTVHLVSSAEIIS